MMTGFFCQDEYLSKTTKLTDEEVGRLFRSLMVYHSTGDITPLDGRESIAFDFIKEDIDKAEEAYTKKCEQARANRRHGLENKATDDNARQPPSTPVNERDHNNINKCNVNKKEKEGTNIRPLKRFEPPTVDEVREYCDARSVYLIDPQRFIDYYETRGWMLTNNRKMVDWKAAVRLWEKNEKERQDKERIANYDLPY